MSEGWIQDLVGCLSYGEGELKTTKSIRDGGI